MDLLRGVVMIVSDFFHLAAMNGSPSNLATTRGVPLASCMSWWNRSSGLVILRYGEYTKGAVKRPSRRTR